MNQLGIAVSLLTLLASTGCNPEPSPKDRSSPSEPNEGCDAVPWFLDADGDGYGDPGSEELACDAPSAQHGLDSGDCDDDAPLVNPGQTEQCDEAEIDEDCDGLVNDADPEGADGAVVRYADADGDGFGDASAMLEVCDPGAGLVESAADCDDTDPMTFPGAAFAESDTLCMTDADGDGFGGDNPLAAAASGTDCDDADVATYPGAAFLDDPTACMTDADTDGFGSDSPAVGAAPGGDCDDTQPTAYPGGMEILSDWIDQDCDGADKVGVWDDFEFGVVDPNTFSSILGPTAEVTIQDYPNGEYGLELGTPGDRVTTVALDTSQCSEIAWSFVGERGPFTEDEDLAVRFWDGTAWVEADRWLGGESDWVLEKHEGTITDPAAFHAQFELELVRLGLFYARFNLDDFFVGCPGADGDGDGRGEHVDCDDSDPDHWDDCGMCVDGDGDGFGQDCDLGQDCDDADSAVHPLALDAFDDGWDANCDGRDGVHLVDDFETGEWDRTRWAHQSGKVEYEDVVARGGSWGVLVDPNWGAVIDTIPMNTSDCADGVAWVVRAQELPTAGDSLLEISYWDGLSWVEVQTWLGDTGRIEDWVDLWGTIDAAAARSDGFQLRLLAYDGVYSDVYLDDVEVGCARDQDGDGMPHLVDCDDSAPAHWSDCGGCDDGDGDGFGSGCDLGPDCDDADASLAPDLHEVEGNGVDENCDGYDAEVVADDFELAVPRPWVWSGSNHTAQVDATASAAAHGGGLRLEGVDAWLESAPIDTLACTDLSWSWSVARIDPAPEVSDDLVLEIDGGLGWVTLDEVFGDGFVDERHEGRQGVLSGPDVASSALVVRVRATGLGAGIAAYAVDDLVIGCGDDTDGDGSPSFADCDPADPLHFSDCATCQDLDGDGYGALCDAGWDCDETSTTVHAGAADVHGDLLDADCDGFDGTALADDFELGVPDPDVWSLVSGDAGVQSAVIAHGSYALHLTDDPAEVITQPIDTTACDEVVWTFQLRRDEPETWDDLVVEYLAPGGWVLAETISGLEEDGREFETHWGRAAAPNALWSGFALRIAADGGSFLDPFYLDDFRLGCGSSTPRDDDGDGIPTPVDCDDTDAWHWTDCAVCEDADLDGSGTECDLGPDCDDADPVLGALSDDAATDGVDWDCDGFDGPPLFFDNVDDGLLPAGQWSAVTGDAMADTAWPWSGSHSLNLEVSGGLARTAALDTTVCAAVRWRFMGKRGLATPDPGEDLTLSYTDGLSTVQLEVWKGGDEDDAFGVKEAVIDDPSALTPSFGLEFQTASVGTSGDFYVDDLTIGCAVP